MPNFSAIRTHSANDPDSHLLHDSPTLDFDGKFAGSQLGGNLLIK